DSSGHVVSAQSWTGFFSLIAEDNAWRDVDSTVSRVNFRARRRADKPVVAGHFGPKRRRRPMMRMANVLPTLTLSLVLTGAAATAHAQTTLDKVSFGTNWVAEAEHGGFFQAVADGTYKKYGLDVTIVPGGPNVNNRILMTSGK